MSRSSSCSDKVKIKGLTTHFSKRKASDSSSGKYRLKFSSIASNVPTSILLFQLYPQLQSRCSESHSKIEKDKNHFLTLYCLAVDFSFEGINFSNFGKYI